jgi:hypothetical protein
MEKGRREAGVPNGTAGCYAARAVMASFFLLRHRYTRGGQEIFQIGTIFAEKVFHSVKRGLGIIVKRRFRHYRYKNAGERSRRFSCGRPPSDLLRLPALPLQAARRQL